MLALTGIIAVIAVLASRAIVVRQRAYFGLLLLLFAAVNGVFVIQDLLAFFVCWEAMLIPMFLLIGIWGGEQRRYAAMKFVLMTMAGSVPMLIAIVALWAAIPAGGVLVAVRPGEVTAHQATLSSPLAAYADAHRRHAEAGPALRALRGSAPGVHGLPLLTRSAEGVIAPAEAATAVETTRLVLVPRSFDMRHTKLLWKHWLSITILHTSLAVLAFWGFVLAFAVKIPVLGLHTWLPHAHVQAPTAISVVLAALLLKLGVYGFLRLAWPCFPTVASDASTIIAAFGTVAVLYAGWVALMQEDLKRLVAYSSVSHMGYCLIGIAALTATGVSGAVVQMITHGIGSALLFLLVGVIYDRAHHRRIAGFGGLATPMPIYAGIFLFVALASAGLPGLAGFIGEILVVVGAVQSDAGQGAVRVLALVSCLGVVISAAYLLWTVRRVFFGPVTVPAYEKLPDLDRTELACLVPLVVLTLLLGVWPQPLLSGIAPAAQDLAAHVLWAVSGAAP
jgi:NADH-quinone oxidoreductase subunit M